MRLILELALFLRSKFNLGPFGFVLDILISKAKDEWLDQNIEKYKNTSIKLHVLLELERQKRASSKPSP